MRSCPARERKRRCVSFHPLLSYSRPSLQEVRGAGELTARECSWKATNLWSSSSPLDVASDDLQRRKGRGSAAGLVQNAEAQRRGEVKGWTHRSDMMAERALCDHLGSWLAKRRCPRLRMQGTIGHGGDDVEAGFVPGWRRLWLLVPMACALACECVFAWLWYYEGRKEEMEEERGEGRRALLILAVRRPPQAAKLGVNSGHG